MDPSEQFLHLYGQNLSRILCPSAPPVVVQAAIRQALQEAREEAVSRGLLPGTVEKNPLPNNAQRWELCFVHDCRNHGCNSGSCVLCKHNPNKRCMGNFAKKYWVGDKLLAKCEGGILIECIDVITGERVTEDLGEMRVEAAVMDGNKFNTRCREAGEQRLEILDECEVLLNQKGEPLLVAGSANNDAENPQVVLKFGAGSATISLRDMKVTESSESVLAGTKRPPFRLVVRAVSASGMRLPVRPAVSEEFVVVTKRTKNLKKQEIPSLDDPISKLNHIGKETVKKLNELKAAADESSVDLPIPATLWRVTKVREFQQLARLSEADGHLQQRLKQLLKLSKEKWDAACEHAKTAVQVDNRMRAWYQKDMALGLLYSCTLGHVRPDCPLALIQNRRADGADFMEVVPCEHQMPGQREQVARVCEAAVQCWWEDSHPGWMIFTLGNQHFETLDQIIQYSQMEGAAGVVATTMPPPMESSGGQVDRGAADAPLPTSSPDEPSDSGGAGPGPSAPRRSPTPGGRGNSGGREGGQVEGRSLPPRLAAQAPALAAEMRAPPPRSGAGASAQQPGYAAQMNHLAAAQSIFNFQNLQQAHTSAALAAMMQGGGGGGADAHNPFEALLGQPFLGGGAPPMRDLTSLAASVEGRRSMGGSDMGNAQLPFAIPALTYTNSGSASGQGLGTTAGLLSLSSLLNLGSLGGSTPGGSWLAASTPMAATYRPAAATSPAGEVVGQRMCPRGVGLIDRGSAL
ncbi:hypothetical protein WJX81_001066 [Elliptochloris bilobata]|uniref:Uncharacterized protein n=1 Tax=Elliptochloris bilobata TaxID=381761 RepID=A0AAW1QWN7_9CHLO